MEFEIVKKEMFRMLGMLRINLSINKLIINNYVNMLTINNFVIITLTFIYFSKFNFFLNTKNIIFTYNLKFFNVII